jgi:DNA-binding NtrC family response regulator
MNSMNLLASLADQDGPIVFKAGTKLKEIEKQVILETLKAEKYNRTHAARVLGIGIRTLQRKLKRYGLAQIGLVAEGVAAVSNA